MESGYFQHLVIIFSGLFHISGNNYIHFKIHAANYDFDPFRIWEIGVNSEARQDLLQFDMLDAEDIYVKKVKIT